MFVFFKFYGRFFLIFLFLAEKEQPKWDIKLNKKIFNKVEERVKGWRKNFCFQRLVFYNFLQSRTKINTKKDSWKLSWKTPLNIKWIFYKNNKAKKKRQKKAHLPLACRFRIFYAKERTETFSFFFFFPLSTTLRPVNCLHNRHNISKHTTKPFSKKPIYQRSDIIFQSHTDEVNQIYIKIWTRWCIHASVNEKRTSKNISFVRGWRTVSKWANFILLKVWLCSWMSWIHSIKLWERTRVSSVFVWVDQVVKQLKQSSI